MKFINFMNEIDNIYIEDVEKEKDIVAIIEKAEDFDDAVAEIIKNRKVILCNLPPFRNLKTIDKTDFYTLIIDKANLVDEAIDLMINDCQEIQTFKTMSDKGGVLVGNDKMQFLINNEIGDGETLVIVDYKEKDYFKGEINFNYNFFTYTTSIDGEFYIYRYDSDINYGVATKLSGHYTVYSNKGIILFEKI